jgi:aspartyl/asparaginyl-tRNA synthetase
MKSPATSAKHDSCRQTLVEICGFETFTIQDQSMQVQDAMVFVFLLQHVHKLVHTFRMDHDVISVPDICQSLNGTNLKPIGFQCSFPLP